MSNTVVFNLPPVEAELYQVREILRCVLHTIVFQRALGYVVPREIDSELADITYVTCGEGEVEARIEAQADEVVAALERRPQDLLQVALSFYEPRRRQAVGWWSGRSEERLYWERWVLDLALVPTTSWAHTQPSAPDRAAALTTSLEGVMAAIVTHVSEQRGHIPPVGSSEVVSFPFDITITGSSARGLGLSIGAGVGAVKRLLRTASPPPVLG